MIPWHKCYYLSDILDFAAKKLSKKEVAILEEALSTSSYKGEITSFCPEEVIEEGPDCWDPEYIQAAHLIHKLGIKNKSITILAGY